MAEIKTERNRLFQELDRLGVDDPSLSDDAKQVLACLLVCLVAYLLVCLHSFRDGRRSGRGRYVS